jgi:hypothetical protein
MIVGFLEYIIALGIGVYGLFVLLTLSAVGEAGYLVGVRHSRRPRAAAESSGVSTITAGILALVGFLLALTISFAQDRYEARRHSTVAEANAIGTAWLRAGLADEAGKPLASLIEDYTRVRLAYLDAVSQAEQDDAINRTNGMQSQIWHVALGLRAAMPAPLAASLIASLNDMFDASLVQRYALDSRPPAEALLTLLGGAVLAMGALGYQLGLGRSRQHLLTFLLIALLSGGITMVVDLSRPRLGLTRVDSRPLQWTLQGFQPGPPR